MHEQEIIYKQIVDDYLGEITHQISLSSFHEVHTLNNQIHQNNKTISIQKSSLQNEQNPQQKQFNQHRTSRFKLSKGSQKSINNEELGKYALLCHQAQIHHNIKISIQKTQKRQQIISSYFVYFINGFDDKGSFSLARRFNEFFEMRTCMVQRWPGCFIPSIPAKNAIMKNNTEIVQRRIRYLNIFVNKISKLPHLYYGIEFQTLLRSQQADISSLYSKWPTTSTESIINKYRINFSQLAGKQINYETNQKINSFIFFIRKNQTNLQKDRQNMKKLADSNDKLNELYTLLFTKVFPTYEKECLSQYCQNQTEMLYLNDYEVKLQEHDLIAKTSNKHNPYWLFYDMIRHEERDGLALLQATEAKAKYDNKRYNLQVKINENEKIIHELSIGKRPISNINSKQTNLNILQKFQSQIQEYKKEKENLLMLSDIITALIAYVEIERYKHQKQLFYPQSIMKIGSNEINKVQNYGEIWQTLHISSSKKLHEQI